MIVGLGTDIVSIERIAAVLHKNNAAFIDRICTPDEKKRLQEGGDITAKLAKIWAVKEAAAKALGTGFALGVKFRDFELRHTPMGKPELMFGGKAAEILDKLMGTGKVNIQVSLSDDKPFAQAIVILEKI